MFDGCESLSSIDMSNFDTKNVKNMEKLFNSCYSLKSIDLSNFNTQNVTNMIYMFYDCKNLTYVDISHFTNTSLVKSYYFFNEKVPQSGTIIVDKNFIDNIIDFIPNSWNIKYNEK